MFIQGFFCSFLLAPYSKFIASPRRSGYPRGNRHQKMVDWPVSVITDWSLPSGLSMASQFQTLVSQKLFLAKTLLAVQEQSDQPAEREAANQGASELMLRARQLLLAMIAELYQHRRSVPQNLAELNALISDEAPEIAELAHLARLKESWWSRLDELEASQTKPPEKQKTVSAENIIAVAVASGPDKSIEALKSIIEPMKQFADTVAERHNEW
ncbi:DUF6586 family protein [Marinobacter mobilis]|nr:DUF6586 family protein [Marinobacter mobilis]